MSAFIMPKNSSAKSKTAQYKKMYKALKPYVDFKIDLRTTISKSQKATITKYFKEFQRVTDGKPYAVQIYRSKDHTRLAKVQQLAGQDSRLKKFKVAFVPKTSNHQKIRFNKEGEPIIKSEHVRSTYIPLDPVKLAGDDTIDYINSVIKNRSEKSYSIQAGDYEISGTFSKDRLANEVNKLCARYANSEENNYFGNWLGGIFANEFTNQSDLDTYREAKRSAQIKRDRSTRRKDKNKKIKLFYWYDRKVETVLLTKTDKEPNNHCEAITRREYDRFLNIGEI